MLSVMLQSLIRIAEMRDTHGFVNDAYGIFTDNFRFYSKNDAKANDWATFQVSQGKGSFEMFL